MFGKIMNTAVLSLGSNVGDRLDNLKKAIAHLKDLPGSLLKVSSVYETAPWGNTQQSSFYNQVIEIETTLTALELMERILSIEREMGRTRMKKWEPRIIDIDILFFSDEIIESKNLRIPHQHLHERRFILEPLNEIMPDFIHPVSKLKIHELLSDLTDDSSVEKLKTISLK